MGDGTFLGRVALAFETSREKAPEGVFDNGGASRPIAALEADVDKGCDCLVGCVGCAGCEGCETADPIGILALAGVGTCS